MLVMGANLTITRPVLRYHGGKFNLASWVISHFPPHCVYLEPYGGAAAKDAGIIREPTVLEKAQKLWLKMTAKQRTAFTKWLKEAQVKQ